MRKVLIGVLAATLFVAACGGSSKKSGTGSSGGTTTTGPGGSTSPTSSGGNDDLSKIAGQYAKAKIKITYASAGSGDSSTITIAQDGNGKSAYTVGDSTFYNDGKTTVSCQGTGTTAKCTQLGSLGGVGSSIGAGFTATFSALAAALTSLGGGDKSSESIAGRDASCVKYKASDVIGRLASSPLFKDAANASDYDPNDTATICVDKQTGFVLKFAGTKKGVAQDELTATAVGEPTDSDFTPPVTPETIPSIPGISIPSIPTSLPAG